MRRSEFDLTDQLRKRAMKNHALRAAGLIRGIGDDAAILRSRPRTDWVITTDLLIEDIDFRRAWMRPRLLGHKTLAVSLSDIAAMGARPRWALLSLGVSPAVWRSRFLDDFFEGFFALAEEHRVTLIGGDVSRTPERTIIDSIVIGEASRAAATLRAGARPGDHIFVTGALGGAAAGLRLLEDGTRLTASDKPLRRPSALQQLLLRHLRPTPRVGWGTALGQKRLATAMIDVSDGLSSDLAHLCRASGVGARIAAANIPVDPSLKRARRGHMGPSSARLPDALSLALHGGEDYELLFTVSPRRLARLPEAVGGVTITHIGEITGEAGRITLAEGTRARVLRPAGFKHFER